MSSYWKSKLAGQIYEVVPCWYCKGAKEVDNLKCHECKGYGVHGWNVTCNCVVTSPDKDCPFCLGTGIRDYRSSIPPTIYQGNWWEIA